MSHSGSSSAPSNKEESMFEEQLPPLEDVPPVVHVEEDEETPEWLKVLLRTNFWESCVEHATENRGEKCMFCLHCYNVSCPHCTHDEPGHRLLKIRRYVYRSVVLAKDIQDLDIDASRIQTYIINGQKVVHLRPMSRSKLFRPQAGTPRCLTCKCWLRTVPNLFCSLTCERKVDVSQEDFSGPEAERRYRSLQTNILDGKPSQEVPEAQVEQHAAPQAQVEHHAPAAPQAQVEHHAHAAPEAPVEHHAAPEAEQDNEPPREAQNGSFRRRGRKQKEPARAPFF